MNKYLTLIGLSLGLLFLSIPMAVAGTSNWTGPGADFNTAGNWDAGVPTDIAGFNSSNPTSLTLSVNTTLNGFAFQSGASAYTIDTNTHILQFNGAGILNNSSHMQTLNNGFGILFNNAASAGNAQITNNFGSQTDFFVNSTAGNSTIINNVNGQTYFTDTSSAGNATLINNYGGSTHFISNSTGGNVSIINNDGFTDFSGLSSSGIAVGSIAGSGNYYLGGKSLMEGGNNTSTVVTGILTGIGGSLIKTGSGTLTLSANNTYTGNTVVNAGTLNLTGSLQADAIVGAGATLSGTGSLKNLINNGVVTPGSNDIGTLMASTYVGPGALNIHFNGSSNSSLSLTGNANLVGGSLNIRGTFFASGTYNVLTANSLTGTFASVNTPSTYFLSFLTQYIPTEVELIIHALNFSSVGQTNNQQNMGAALDVAKTSATGSFATTLGAIQQLLSASQAQDAYNQISGDALASFHEVGFRTASLFTKDLSNRITPGGSLNVTSIQAPVQLAFAGNIQDLGSVNTSSSTAPNGIWARGIGSFDHIKADSTVGSPDAQANMGGFELGYDREIGNQGLVGISGGSAKTNLTVDDRSSSGHTDTTLVGLYGRYAPDPWFFIGSLAYSGNSNEMSRHISFPGIDEQANASFTSRIYTSFVQAGYTYKPKRHLSLSPSLSLRESRLVQEGYTETGAPGLDLTTANQTIDSLVSSLGLRLSRQFFTNSSHPATMGVRTAWEHELASADNSITAQFADAPGPTFTVQGTPRDRNAAAFGLDGRMTLLKDLQAFADYSDTLSSGRNTQVIAGGLKLAFSNIPFPTISSNHSLNTTSRRNARWNAYLGPTFSWLSLGGDFDGQHILFNQNTGEVFAVPSFDSAIGLGGVVGIRNPIHNGKIDFAFELNYQQASMNNSLSGTSNSDKAILHEVGLTWKGYFRADQVLQPFVAVGFDIPWIIIPDGELSLATLTTQDETFRGVGFHGGGGVSYFISPQWCLETSLLYHHRDFTSVNGQNLQSFSKTSISFEPTISIQYHFGRSEPITVENPITHAI